ncbi:MAG TPA: putative Ig domain-containing protein, partial [Myxococcaceae bacterium]
MSRVRWPLAGVLALVVLSACPPPPSITMPADDLGDTTVVVPYSHTITATGGSGTLSYAASGLPAGLSMSASGTISGTATATGDFSVNVTATDAAAQTASQAYPFKVYPAPAITTATLPDGTQTSSYSAAVSTTGGKAPVVLSVSAGALPFGLALNASTSTISGIAITDATYTFTLQARDANGATAAQSYTVTIYTGLSGTAYLPTTGNVGTPFSAYMSARDGRPPIIYSVGSGALPPGVSLNASDGTITGTPTFAGTYPVSVTATDANGASISVGPWTITIFANAPPVVATTSLPNGVVGVAYSAALVAQQGRPPYAWSLATGSSLPAGLALAANGQISGTPTATGPTDFRVVVTDANGQTA